jgi:hypothetical protein
MYNSPDYWIDWYIPKRRDIALRRPAHLPKAKRFETERDAHKRAVDIIIPGLWNSLPSTAQKIEECASDDQRCLLPICPICARDYRRYFFSEALRLYEENPTGARTATVYLRDYKTGNLKGASLTKIQDAFRKRLWRCKFITGQS